MIDSITGISNSITIAVYFMCVFNRRGYGHLIALVGYNVCVFLIKNGLFISLKIPLINCSKFCVLIAWIGWTITQNAFLFNE